MKRCLGCGKYNVQNPDHDYCHDCFAFLENRDKATAAEDHFEEILKSNRIHTVYVMFYGSKDKIGYTNDLDSRIMEVKRKYPKNELVYFREFVNKTEALRFEAWMKGLSERKLTKIISGFQDKMRKVRGVS